MVTVAASGGTKTRIGARKEGREDTGCGSSGHSESSWGFFSFFLFESQVNRLKMKRQGKPKGVACVGGIGVYARANVCLCVCVYPRARLREYVGLSICASTRKKDGDRKS